MAQFGASVAIDSDYRYRGVTLSDSKPDARLSVSYDGAGGWYAGGTLTRIVFEPDQGHAGVYAYAGITRPLTATLRWEAGAMRASYVGDERYDYAEAYAGLIGEQWSARVYLSPDYYGTEIHTAYAELDGGWPLARSWRLIGHAGSLVTLTGTTRAGMSRTRLDGRAGVAWSGDDGWTAQFVWAGSTPGGPYPSAYERRRSNVILSVSYAF
jgi:uncharacterized protein (TIGR02001 family)